MIEKNFGSMKDFGDERPDFLWIFLFRGKN